MRIDFLFYDCAITFYLANSIAMWCEKETKRKLRFMKKKNINNKTEKKQKNKNESALYARNKYYYV